MIRPKNDIPFPILAEILVLFILLSLAGPRDRYGLSISISNGQRTSGVVANTLDLGGVDSGFLEDLLTARCEC
jgi:hypothetical protein